MDINKVVEFLKIFELPLSGKYDQEDIKKQYRKLAQKYHPDTTSEFQYKNGEKFKIINEANKGLKENLLINQEIDFSNIVFTTKQERKTAHTKKPQSAGKYSYWAEWVDVTAYNLEDIEWFDPDSSNVAMFGYDESEKYLYIQFKSNKNIVYCYYDFQRWAFFEFLNAESKGRYVYYEIIKKYKCVKMDISAMSPEWKRNIKKI